MMMNWLRKLIQMIGCDHEYEFVRNLYGDEINQHDGKRSEWQCWKCEKYQYRKDLYNVCTREQLHQAYDKYCKDKQERWENEKRNILAYFSEEMTKAASSGLISIDFYVICDIDTRNYIYNWFDDNMLLVNCEIVKEYDDNVIDLTNNKSHNDCVQFHVTW